MTTFGKLQSWTESDNEEIRFFSGIATYRKTFELPESLAKRNRLFLQLGNLAEIAEVTLNGKRLGLAWLPPYRIEISGAVRAGANQVEIRVANLWANRLNGDSLRPESESLHAKQPRSDSNRSDIRQLLWEGSPRQDAARLHQYPAAHAIGPFRAGSDYHAWRLKLELR